MIPRILHFVFGLQADFGGKPFSFVHWAAVRSALKHNPNYRCIFWYSHRPEGHYFDDVADGIELRKIEAPTNIFGNPLMHVAHQADVVRLRALQEFGGFYLDLDTITTRSFDSLRDHRFIMALERAGATNMGLCNAIMGAEPKSSFGARWLESYRTFRAKGHDQYWNEHSVIVPWNIAKAFPSELTILPQEIFFHPDWTPAGLEQLFIEEHDFPDAYAHHLWESHSWGALSSFNESNVTSIANSYTRILNRDLPDEIEGLRAARRKWVHDRIASGAAYLNLGCGSKFDAQYINCDLFPQSGADLLFDLMQPNWPLPESCIAEAKLHHVLEHLSGDLSTFFRELYRVCRPGAIVDVRVPHPRHDWFLSDPTHVRPLLAESFYFLDRRICLQWFFGNDSKTPLALYWGIDFEILNPHMMIDASSERLGWLLGPPGKGPPLENVLPYFSNIASEIVVQLRARKPAPGG